jgi:hypothetical protein
LRLSFPVLWSLGSVEEADTKAVRIRSEAATALVDEEREEREAAALIDSLDATIREFLSATSVEKLTRLVRHPARVTPFMREYYADQPVFPGRLKRIRALQPLTLDNRGNFWVASVSLGDEDDRSMILEIEEDGRVRVDWETFVCYQAMPWDEFARERPTGTSLDFRVYVEVDNLYSHEFANSDKWACFRITAMDGEETVYGYAHADGEEARELLTLIGLNQGAKTSVILRLVIPEGLQSRQGAVIEKLLCRRWIYLDSPNSSP